MKTKRETRRYLNTIVDASNKTDEPHPPSPAACIVDTQITTLPSGELQEGVHSADSECDFSEMCKNDCEDAFNVEADTIMQNDEIPDIEKIGDSTSPVPVVYDNAKTDINTKITGNIEDENLHCAKEEALPQKEVVHEIKEPDLVVNASVKEDTLIDLALTEGKISQADLSKYGDKLTGALILEKGEKLWGDASEVGFIQYMEEYCDCGE